MWYRVLLLLVVSHCTYIVCVFIYMWYIYLFISISFFSLLSYVYCFCFVFLLWVCVQVRYDSVLFYTSMLISLVSVVKSCKALWSHLWHHDWRFLSCFNICPATSCPGNQFRQFTDMKIWHFPSVFSNRSPEAKKRNRGNRNPKSSSRSYIWWINKNICTIVEYIF